MSGAQVSRWKGPVEAGALILTAVLLAILAGGAMWVVAHPAAFANEAGGDFRAYTDAARRWLGGGSFYSAHQVAGPYNIFADGYAVLYPPTFLVLLVPFAVLPIAPLWWLIPIVGVVAIVAWHRAPVWTWPLMLAPFATQHAGHVLINGTPTIWIVLFVAVATVRPWLGALALLKPAVAPFALIGITNRRWWALAIVLVGLSLPLAGDYVAVLTNAKDGTLWYARQDVPMLLVPIVAWWAGARRRFPSLTMRKASPLSVGSTNTFHGAEPSPGS